MKYLKTLGLLAVAVAALLAFAGTASATLTSPAGTKLTGTIKATSTNTHLIGTVKIGCKHSQIAATITSGATSAPVSELTITQCDPDTWIVLKKGVLTIDSLGGGKGTVTLNNSEITGLTHKFIFGFPITTHCIYGTSNTVIGTFTSSASATSSATIHINGEIPRIATDSACGEDPAIWTGTYTVTSPVPLFLD